MYLLSLMLENYLQSFLDCYCISYREGLKVARDTRVKRKMAATKAIVATQPYVELAIQAIIATQPSVEPAI